MPLAGFLRRPAQFFRLPLYHTWQAFTGAMGCPGLHAKAF
jgi:hypothetical protein